MSQLAQLAQLARIAQPAALSAAARTAGRIAASALLAAALLLPAVPAQAADVPAAPFALPAIPPVAATAATADPVDAPGADAHEDDFGVILHDDSEAWINLRTSLAEAWQATLRVLVALGHAVEADLPYLENEGRVISDGLRISVERHGLEEAPVVRVRVAIPEDDAEFGLLRAQILLDAIADRVELAAVADAPLGFTAYTPPGAETAWDTGAAAPLPATYNTYNTYNTYPSEQPSVVYVAANNWPYAPAYSHAWWSPWWSWGWPWSSHSWWYKSKKYGWNASLAWGWGPSWGWSSGWGWGWCPSYWSYAPLWASCGPWPYDQTVVVNTTVVVNDDDDAADDNGGNAPPDNTADSPRTPDRGPDRPGSERLVRRVARDEVASADSARSGSDRTGSVVRETPRGVTVTATPRRSVATSSLPRTSNPSVVVTSSRSTTAATNSMRRSSQVGSRSLPAMPWSARVNPTTYATPEVRGPVGGSATSGQPMITGPRSEPAASGSTSGHPYSNPYPTSTGAAVIQPPRTSAPAASVPAPRPPSAAPAPAPRPPSPAPRPPTVSPPHSSPPTAAPAPRAPSPRASPSASGGSGAGRGPR